MKEKLAVNCKGSSSANHSLTLQTTTSRHSRNSTEGTISRNPLEYPQKNSFNSIKESLFRHECSILSTWLIRRLQTSTTTTWVSLFLYSTLPRPSLSILEEEKRENDKVGGGDLPFSRSLLIPGSWLSRGNRLGSLHPRNGRFFIGIEILFLRCVENLSLSNHLSCCLLIHWSTFLTGSGGLEELEDEFNDGKVQFAFCRVKDPNTKLDKFVLISWVSPSLSYPLKNDLEADRFECG